MYQTSSPCSCQPQQNHCAKIPSVSPSLPQRNTPSHRVTPWQMSLFLGWFLGGIHRKLQRNHKKPQSIKKLKKRHHRTGKKSLCLSFSVFKEECTEHMPTKALFCQRCSQVPVDHFQNGRKEDHLGPTLHGTCDHLALGPIDTENANPGLKMMHASNGRKSWFSLHNQHFRPLVVHWCVQRWEKACRLTFGFVWKWGFWDIA